MNKFLILSILLFSVAAFSENNLKHNSEMSAILITNSETYSAKQSTDYHYSFYTYSINGEYLLSQSRGEEIAKSWLIKFKIEKELSSIESRFLAHTVESNQINGLQQRNSSDIGMKYKLIGSGDLEIGYRYVNEFRRNHSVNSLHFGRVYNRWAFEWGNVVSGIWAEYLHNFTVEGAYQYNYEYSFGIRLSQYFLLSFGHLIKYDHRIGQQDRLTTIAILAKY